jgi:hypothetical protein
MNQTIMLAGSSGLDFTQFQLSGRYRVTFRYSTKSANLQE